MIRLLTRRVSVAIPLILFVTFVVFVLIDRAPGDPAITLAGENPAPERVVAIREALRLDDPVPVRWAAWLGDVVLHGDLGISLQTRQEVSDLVGSRLTVTVSLVGLSIVMASAFAVVLGVAGALRPRGFVDRAVTALASVGLAVPPFWLGIFLVSTFAVGRNWFPAIGYASLSEGFWPWLQHLLLPALSLSMFLAAEFTLQLKGALIEALGKDYVLAADAKGLPRAKVIGKHALKNALVPVATVAGLRIAGLIGGTATIESVFNLQGIGALAVGSTINRDVSVMLGVLLVSCVMVQIVNLLVDVSYGYLNPRVRT